MPHPARLMLASLLALTACLSTGCAESLGEPDDGAGGQELLFTFDRDAQGWGGSFTDLSPEQAESVGFVFEHRALPPEVVPPGSALFISGRNVSDDLFMFLTYPVTGLSPDTDYALTFELELASNAPTGCVGTGGAPGESVFLKAGAATVQPERVSDSNGTWRLNVDKGEQSSGGANAKVVGDIANGSPDCNATAYQRITRDNRAAPFRIRTDASGLLWLLVGTDSGFESTTALYYDTIRVVLEPLPQ